MLISLNEIKKLVKVDLADTELVKLIGSRLVEVESVTDLKEKYKKIYLVKVLSAEDIEGTHLHLCKIDAGEELGHSVQVVCGAPNVHAGMLAAWIAPGAIVPATFGTNEPFEIAVRKLRGFESNGMLAAADELALGTDHAGIIEFSPDLTAAPGTPLVDVLDLDDKIIEVENKSLTHRPDCFGLIGFAREVAGILGQQFVEPRLPQIDCEAKKGSVTIESPDLCPCYSYSVINLENPLAKKPYFDFGDVFLAKAGMHSISPIVDVTNIYMLLTGQPLHAFDYDKFLKVGGTAEPKIGVRLAREPESLTLLDGSNVKLTQHDIVITSNDVPVALAGAMGGESTKIDETTKRVILESATFSLYNLRKTQMAHGIFSEAITRFTKGQPAANCEPVLLAATQDIVDVSQRAQAEFYAVHYAAPLAPIVITLTTKEINALLGSSYTPELIIQTLENTGFAVKPAGETLTVTAPAWRTDIHIKEDIIEEVGRLLGFDNLPLNFPLRPFVCPSVDELWTLKEQLRTLLSDRLDANELLTYSFVSKALQEKAGEDVTDSYRIVNSLSPELDCFRQTLVPSLLEKLRENQKAGYKERTLYELNQVTRKSLGLNDEGVPVMETDLGVVMPGDFYAAKAVLLELEKYLGAKFELSRLETDGTFEPVHAAAIYLNETKVGQIGEIKAGVCRAFKLGETVSALELTLDKLLGQKTQRTAKIALSRFPSVSRDLTVRVDADTAFEQVEAAIRAALSQNTGLLYTIEPVSIFRKEETSKNLSFHLEMTSTEKTLESKEISAIIEKITNSLTELGAEVV